jgi:aminoglycoside N3'-acetyltransferase
MEEPVLSSSVKVSPDDLTSAFHRLGLREGTSVMLHASMENMGTIDGGAAMVLHRLLGVLGKKATLMHYAKFHFHNAICHDA